MTKATVDIKSFQDLYTRFMNTYTDAAGPVIVMYYQENQVVHAYMCFADVIWATDLDVKEASKYLSMFGNPIKLSKAL